MMFLSLNLTQSANLCPVSIIPISCSSKARRSIQVPTASVTYESKRRVEFYDMHRDLVPYARAWSWQKDIVKKKKLLNEKEEDYSDSLIILQHYPVYTLGAGSSERYLKFELENSPFEVYRTERGGEVTYHGPGQLVMYPIINLRYHGMDLHWYLRALEEVAIRVLHARFSIKASRVEGLTGVWVGDRKMAAIGIKVSQWIAYHGLALNVAIDMAGFDRIVPCGIKDRRVGSIKGLLQELGSSNGHGFGMDDDDQLIDLVSESLVKEFCEVFQVDLKPVLENAESLLVLQ